MKRPGNNKFVQPVMHQYPVDTHQAQCLAGSYHSLTAGGGGLGVARSDINDLNGSGEYIGARGRFEKVTVELKREFSALKS